MFFQIPVYVLVAEEFFLVILSKLKYLFFSRVFNPLVHELICFNLLFSFPKKTVIEFSQALPWIWQDVKLLGIIRY